MDQTTKVRTLLLRAQDRKPEAERSFSHPMNPKSEIHGFSLSDAVGLERLGVHLIRVPPGKESFVFHKHYGEEEFLFIISGRGIAEIGDEEFEIGAGDFMGFPTPSVGHHLRNPFDEDLVYVSGGERRALEVADLPKHGKRLVRVGRQASLHALEPADTFPGFDPVK